MRKYFLGKLIFLLLLALIAKQDLYAQFEEGQPFDISTPIVGTSIVNNASNTVTYSSAGEISKKITNVITLKINEQSNLYFASAFTATAQVKIESWTTVPANINNPGTPNASEVAPLTVSYDPATGVKYDVRSYRVLPAAAEFVRITVSNFSTTGGAGWAFKNVLTLENEMKVLRYYALSEDASVLSPIFNAAKMNADANGNIDALNLSWSWPANANNNISQLEWAWVEDEMLGFYGGNYNSIFYDNSTRVDVTNNSFSIPLLYEGVGHLYFRIRAAYRKDNGTIIAGPWSGISDEPFSGHAPNLNWQSTTSFAEDAKLKSVIQYFDGTLRNRQTVTKDYSTHNTIVGETIYDMQGRPNVQILPTPTIDSVIHYFKNFNRFVGQASITNTDGSQYLDDPARYFDLTPADVKCNRSPALDSTYTSGSAKYYSSNNDWLSTEAKTKNIPDAQGYPYTETRYTDDPTQRVETQGGVGVNHQIGSGHETNYFYGKPAQQEMDALFGTEVGDASHYSKNMVQDANGQMSVSYVDMHGRTIATSLAGASPTQLNSIDNPTDYPSAAGTLTNQLLTPSTNVINGNSIESISTILVPAPTVDTFYYSLVPSILSQMNCNNQQICFDCKYNLEISIRSEACSNNAPIIYDYNNLQIVPANAACGTAMGFIGSGITTPTNQIVDTATLSAGSWVIRKTLTINDSMFEVRKDSALKAFLCTTETNLYNTIYSQLSTTSACNTPITNTAVTGNLATLTRIRNQMLADMTPYTGQYAEPLAAFNAEKLPAQYNIFAANYFRNPENGIGSPGDYLNNQGNPDVNIELAGSGDKRLLNTITPDNFTGLFQPSWATSLFYYHPEYTKWSYAENNLAAAYSWMDNIQNCSTYAQAKASGYVSGAATDNSILSSDPYFKKGGTTADFQNMNTDLTAYIVTQWQPEPANDPVQIPAYGSNNNPTIWQLANSSVTCATVDSVHQNACIAIAYKTGLDPLITATADQDKAWQRYSAIYLSYRNPMVIKFIDKYATNPLSQANMNILEAAGKQMNFALVSDIVNQDGWSSFLTPNLLNNGDATGVDAAANAYISDSDLVPDNCAAQKPYWKSKLLQCEQFMTLLSNNNTTDSATVNRIINTILDSMVMVCHNSITPQQTYGATNVNPSYTGVPQSFEDVVNHVFAQNNIATLPNNNYFCNPFTVDYPKPFGDNTPVAVNYSNTIDSCGCAMYAKIKGEASSMGFDTLSFSSMNHFLQANYEDSLTLPLWTGLQQCKYQFVCTPEYLPVNLGNASPPKNSPAPPYNNCPGTSTAPEINSVTIVNYSPTTFTQVIINYSMPKSSFDFLINQFYLYYTTYPAGGIYSVPIKNQTGTSNLTLYLPPTPTAYAFVIRNLGYGGCGQSNTVVLDTVWQTICEMTYPSIIMPDQAVIPTFLNCGYQKPCITCGKLDSLTMEFRQIFPAYGGVPYLDTAAITDDQQSQNALWARFINYRTGFTKNPDDYITSYMNCGLTAVCGPNTGVDNLYVNARLAPYQSEYTARVSVTVEPGFESIPSDDFLIDINPNLLNCARTNSYPNTALCSFSKPLNDISNIFTADSTPCAQVATQALFEAQQVFQEMQDSLIANFDSLYTAKCLGAQSNEAFYVKYKPSEYHYTLYYYDQAGNLVKTLPPAAVRPNYDPTYLYNDSVARANKTDLTNGTNNEQLGTRYCYNTLNQVVAQKTPDAGISQFWYDPLGRLVVSQNAKQILNGLYSYTLYDPLGRITEVGQKPNQVITQSISQNPLGLNAWMGNGGAKQQITRTFYDVPFTPIAVSNPGDHGLYQQNLRNRVSFTYIENADDPVAWDAATFYSYDPHGNVDTLLQDYKSGMGAIHCNGSSGTNEFKRIVYSYDLISGKVNQVAYQPGQADQFYHQYSYDAENRLISVQTSQDSIYWENDASYDYYRHGPLDRTVLGQNQVQGIDYAYTLQGWLKGVNGNYLNSATDMGSDGLTTGTNSFVSKDAYAFTLGYFNGDYLPIGGSTANAFAQNAPASDIINNGVTASNLYNGNISYSFNSLWPLDYNTTTGASSFMGYNYTYDQLNRLASVNASRSSTTTTGVGTGNWPMITNAPLEHVTYDPNGNIRTYLRNRIVAGTNSFTSMDQLTYNYNFDANGKLINNQLQGVTDGVTVHTDDIGSDTYTFDAIGELATDHAQNIASIIWTVYGKIQTITESTGTVINYTYDAAGDRISKAVKTGGQLVSTYYVRDATGNVMSTYTINSTINNNDLTQSEIDLYGSNRLGVYNVNVDVENCTNTIPNPVTIFARGNKFFELDNHLGNVMATVSDKKIGHLLSGGTTIDYYIPDVVTANDYYPFGMLESGRSYSQPNSSYRYGFNGKENDNNIEPEAQDYGMRIYDTRLARFLSVDPATKKYPELTSYQFASNRPIDGVDQDGLEYSPKGRLGASYNYLARDQTAVTHYPLNPEFAQQQMDHPQQLEGPRKRAAAEIQADYKSKSAQPVMQQSRGLILTQEQKDEITRRTTEAYYKDGKDPTGRNFGITNFEDNPHVAKFYDHLLAPAMQGASIALGGAELGIAIKSGESFPIFIKGLSVANSIDDLTGISSHIDNNKLQMGINIGKGLISGINIGSGIVNIPKINTTSGLLKTTFNTSVDIQGVDDAITKAIRYNFGAKKEKKPN